MPKLVKNESGYLLEGSLIYDTAVNFLADCIELETTAETVIINCEKLDRIDSAGVAILISWQRWCEEHNQKLQLKNLPKQAISLIKANKLERFFDSL